MNDNPVRIDISDNCLAAILAIGMVVFVLGLLALAAYATYGH